MSAGHAPRPLDRHLDLCTVLVHIDGDAIYEHTHDLLAVLRGRFRGVPQGWDVVRQAQHLLKVAGAEHVAIGADFEGGIRPAAGLNDASHFPELARALGRAGVGAAVVRQVFSENALRVLCGSGK